MSEHNHPIKSATGTAGLVTTIVALTPEYLRDHDAFLYLISILPPFIVWIQNWLWRNGASIIKDLGGKAKAWKMEREVKNIMKDPLVYRGHKAKLKKAYSDTKTDTLLTKIEDLKNSL
jgi:hypothetical protein